MNLIDRIRANKADSTPRAAPGRLRASANEERWRIPSAVTVEQQAQLYINLSWIQIAIGLSAQTCAATDFRVQQGEKVIPDHPLAQLLRKPNPDMAGFAFLEETFAWRNVAGTCYWWLNTPAENLPPTELWIMPANRIEPVPDGNLGKAGYWYDPGDGQKEWLEAWEVVQFKTWNPLSRYVGLSAEQAVNVDSQTDLASQRFSANFYAKDNAKAGGILAFADNIDDPRWQRMDADIKEQHGGTKNNRIMRLRNVGPGGVQWITTQFTQTEMQYLEQRRFTKEEIYDLFAPGLSSMLAVNATEANSTAAKDTFLSMAIYPQHKAVAEQIALKLLPLYGGDNERCDFEDVRRVDTLIELKEQAEYSRTHTVDEVRKKYYGDKPLGDERGKRFPGESTKPAPQPAQLDPQNPPQDAIVAAGKMLDRRRWRDKAAKALVAGKELGSVTFEPDYLTEDEAMQIRADLKRARTAEDVATVFKGE